ncbi:hypothetical protein Sden_3247 [Shewanella denitrificans OS217]|uniref:Uncharacterized protein n=1 Tax=Shewanella denitrificans (strain OS217 / ATCC BAA-1090 / DSM 15013) TaxID=318161 RepID=Q12J53_SHEDO|nr:hypothetical protein [Shewanella denitrificans]ABE56523.1 hypothetical protein Sden_3247 [Shewanella denitrificans OS217]
MPNVGKNFADRASAKMVRVFQRLAEPCLFTPTNGSAAFTRLVSLDDNAKDLSSGLGEYLPQLVTRAEFLHSEGAVNSGDEFDINGQHGRLTQRVSMDSISVTFIYIPLET